MRAHFIKLKKFCVRPISLSGLLTLVFRQYITVHKYKFQKLICQLLFPPPTAASTTLFVTRCKCKGRRQTHVFFNRNVQTSLVPASHRDNSSRQRLWGPPSLLSSGYPGSYPIHLHLVSRMRIRGAILHLPQ